LTDQYFQTRFSADPRRETLWQTLVQYYFQPRIPQDSCVLELGAGYGHFINNVRAQRRIAQDQWPDFAQHLEPGVESHVGPVTDLSFLADNSVDFVFASNLFEHVTQQDFASVLQQLRRKLTPIGTLTILQPNYRYAFRDYFDDYTHITPYSHVSICDFLQANSYEVIHCAPRFMPLTLKSRLKVSPLLIRLYLLSPLKPLGKQMLVQARPNQEAN
jgi:ubiquinone/menaquinone biosynthesis C-methylase UbiE